MPTLKDKARKGAKMAYQFLNDPLDVDWLREVHVRHAGRIQSFIIKGNEDCPEAVIVYPEPNPDYDAIGTLFRRDDTGDDLSLHLVGPIRARDLR